ncbi:MAG: C40 family peptidase, partial [Spirochaetaceae bacterium]|nr:C40 family peptidase [Spirochaetaceae bacterium]
FSTRAAAEPVSGILHNARSLIGTPYRTGGIAPGGFDCSGFVSYLYRPTLPEIPRISRSMAVYGQSVEYGNWLPGDLLFYATGSDPSRINHVAIWYGEKTIIHSISDGPETGVVITPSDSRYWSRRYITSKRVLTETPEIMPIPDIEIEENSPWDDFDGILRGDFDSWQQADKDAFEKYKKENG